MSYPDGWIVPAWPAPPRVRALITTRNGGISSGPHHGFNLGLHTGDDARIVQNHRRELTSHLPRDPVWLNQKHGAVVVDAAHAVGIPDADAAYSRVSGVVCAVLVADCLPVLLCDNTGSVAGVAHAGWRGMSSGIIEATVCAMNTPANQLMAYLGPAIGPTAFEVGDDVRDAFLAADSGACTGFTKHTPGKWLANLPLLARLRLRAHGISRVYGGADCTYSDPSRFFSYRRDGVTGRMAALIWLAPDAA